MRGYALDVRAAVRALRAALDDAQLPVVVIGASMGARAAGMACAMSADDDNGEALPSVASLVLLAPPPFERAGDIEAQSVTFVVAKGDRLRDGVERMAHELPKSRLELLDGSAHAQHIFKDAEGGDKLLSLLIDDIRSQIDQ